MMYRLPPLGELANKLEVKSNLPSADDSASHAPPSSRRWNSETLRAAYMLIGKEMRRQLEIAAATRFADQQQLLRHAQAVAKETGEANSAIIGAAQPSATEADRRAALTEIEEAIGVLKSAIPLLSPQPP